MSVDIIFETMTLRNFMSYGNAPITIPLNLPGTTLIQGENLDNTEQGIVANGVGKTTLVHALVYVLYGEALSSSMKLDELVNDVNERNCMVSVDFRINGVLYTISRYRKSNEGPDPHFVTIYRDGDLTKNLADNFNKVNDYILELIGIPKALFVRLVVYDADEESFLKLSAGDQRVILENLFNLTILSEKAELLKIESSKTAKLIDHEQISIDQQVFNFEQYNRRLSTSQKRVDDFEEESLQTISDIKSLISKHKNIDIDTEREYLNEKDQRSNSLKHIDQDIQNIDSQLKENDYTIKGLQDNINSTSDLIKAEHVTNTQSIAYKINELRHLCELTIKDRQELVSQKDNISREIKQLHILTKSLSSNKELVNNQILQYTNKLKEVESGRCPECNQPIISHEPHNVDYLTLIQDSNLSIDDFDRKIVDNGIKSDELITQLDILQHKIDDINVDTINIPYINQIETLTSELTNTKEVIETTIKVNTLPIITQQQTIKDHNAILLLQKDAKLLEQQTIKSLPYLGKFGSEIELIKHIGTIEQLQTKLKDKQFEVNPHTDALNEIKNENIGEPDYTNINALKTRYDHEKFLIKLLMDKKSFLRKSLISRRLPYLNERLKVYLKQMGLPHHIEIQSDLIPIIKKRGKVRGFNNLSHGQKARVNFALSFAFRDVQMQMHKRINICILDEVLDKALCGVGTQSAMAMIIEKSHADNLSMFVITHKNELVTKFKRVMTVTMKNGFSSVKVQDKVSSAS